MFYYSCTISLHILQPNIYKILELLNIILKMKKSATHSDMQFFNYIGDAFIFS